MKKSLMSFLLSLGLVATAQAMPLAQRYAQTCGSCHASGLMGAPKAHDQAAWAPRLKRGDAVLLDHAKNGYNMMPARGLCNDCSDAEYKALIKFMSH